MLLRWLHFCVSFPGAVSALNIVVIISLQLFSSKRGSAVVNEELFGGRSVLAEQNLSASSRAHRKI